MEHFDLFDPPGRKPLTEDEKELLRRATEFAVSFFFMLRTKYPSGIARSAYLSGYTSAMSMFMAKAMEGNDMQVALDMRQMFIDSAKSLLEQLELHTPEYVAAQMAMIERKTSGAKTQ